MTRRAFVRGMLATAAAGAGVTGYAAGLEPKWLAVERVEVEAPGLPAALAGLTIAHLSDLHWGPYTGEREIGGAVEAANALAPDLIAVTGDFVYHVARYAPPCAAALAALHAPLGVWAIAGNHDHWAGVSTVRRELEAAGLTWLANSAQRLVIGGAPLWIAGVDDACEGKADLPATLAGIPAEEPVLLLAHEPDLADEAARGATVDRAPDVGSLPWGAGPPARGGGAHPALARPKVSGGPVSRGRLASPGVYQPRHRRDRAADSPELPARGGADHIAPSGKLCVLKGVLIFRGGWCIMHTRNGVRREGGDSVPAASIPVVFPHVGGNQKKGVNQDESASFLLPS